MLSFYTSNLQSVCFTLFRTCIVFPSSEGKNETNFTSVWVAVKKKIVTITPEFSSFLTEGNIQEINFKISIYADKIGTTDFFFFFHVEQGVLKFNFIQD